jgi:hypothetical protein
VLAVDAVAVQVDASTLRRWPAVLAVEAVAVELDAPRRGGAALAVLAVDAVAVELDAPRRGGAALAGIAVDAVAVELDARLDVAALACGARRRCRGRRAGLARLDAAALPLRCSPSRPAPSSWTRASTPASTRRRCPRGDCFAAHENGPTYAHENGPTLRARILFRDPGSLPPGSWISKIQTPSS